MLVYKNNQFVLTNKPVKSKSTTIILLNWNSLDLLINCISLIEKNTVLPYTILIVDNGSTDESLEYISASKYRHIFNSHNFGFAKGMNVGIRNASPSDNIVLMNVDAEPQSGWLEEIYKTYDVFDNVGLIGSLGNNLPSGYQSIDFVKQDTIVSILMFYCVFITRELINKIGLLDERYGLGGFDDNDLSYRSLLAGFNNIISAKSIVLHEPHQVTVKNGLPHNLYEQNRDVFHEKFHSVLTNYARYNNLFSNIEFSKKTGLICD